MQTQRLSDPAELQPGRRRVVTCAEPSALVMQLRELPDVVAGVRMKVDGAHRFDVERLRPGLTQRIADYVGWDQRRLDDVLEEVYECVDARDWSTALGLFKDFVAGVCRHMEWEEAALLPRIKGIHHEPIPRVKDHPVIRARAVEALEALKRRSRPSFHRAIGGLVEVNQEHEFAEEVELYPRLDAVLAPGEARQLIFELIARGSPDERDFAGACAQ